ncbi:MAG: hypothetical protein IKH88_12835 [Prevotella sp.]|nr:hypothetical protein [Prevotella sp.]
MVLLAVGDFFHNFAANFREGVSSRRLHPKEIRETQLSQVKEMRHEEGLKREEGLKEQEGLKKVDNGRKSEHMSL